MNVSQFSVRSGNRWLHLNYWIYGGTWKSNSAGITIGDKVRTFGISTKEKKRIAAKAGPAVRPKKERRMYIFIRNKRSDGQWPKSDSGFHVASGAMHLLSTGFLSSSF